MESRQVFEQLYRDHADRVHSYARRRSDAAVADDVVAEVFLVVWRRLQDVPAEPLPWLLGVARRVLANRRRSDSRIAALRSRLATDEPVLVTVPADSERDLLVRETLAGLSARDRELLLLVAWEGLAVNEAAEVLGVRPGALAMRLHRARARLAHALAEAGIRTELEVGR